MPSAASPRFSRIVRLFGFGLAFATSTIACASPANAAPPAEDAADAGAPDAGSLRTDVPPGGNFDLSHWSLDEPIGVPGAPVVIPASALAGPSGFHDAYFFTDPVDGAMTFWAPESGVSWAGSRFPRTELAERVDDGSRANWLVNGTHVLAATVAVVTVPDHVCVGQIHAFHPVDPTQPSGPPLLELYYYSGGMVVLGLEDSPAGGQTPHVLGNVSPTDPFRYEIELTGDGTITVTLDGDASTFRMPEAFRGYGMYFKAGDYDQTVGSDETVGAKVKFYALTFRHSP